METTDIYTKLERYSEITFGLDALQLEKKELLDKVIPDELKAVMAEIEAEFGDKAEAMSDERAALEAEIKEAVLAAGQTIKGSAHSFTFTKGRVSWNAKLLDGFAIAHPEITVARTVGEPSVSIRKA